MVDREARRQYAQLLRRLAIRRISPRDFDSAVEGFTYQGNDPVFGAVWEETFGIEKTPRRDVARWILFLQSDVDYEWPALEQAPNPFHVIACVLLAFPVGSLLHSPRSGFWVAVGGGVLLQVAADFLASKRGKRGDRMVWPFYDQDGFDEARRHPRLLNARPGYHGDGRHRITSDA